MGLFDTISGLFGGDSSSEVTRTTGPPETAEEFYARVDEEPGTIEREDIGRAIEWMRDGDAATRRQASDGLERLLQIGHLEPIEPWIEDLARLLETGPEDVREDARFTLANLATFVDPASFEPAIDALVETLDSPDAKARQHTVVALSPVVEAYPGRIVDAVPELAAILRDESVDVPDETATIVSVLAREFPDRVARESDVIVHRVSEIGTDPGSRSYEQARSQLLDALERIAPIVDSDRSWESDALSGLLFVDDPETQKRVCRVLGSLGEETAIPDLERLRKETTTADVREAANEAISRIEAAEPAASTAQEENESGAGRRAESTDSGRAGSAGTAIPDTGRGIDGEWPAWRADAAHTGSRLEAVVPTAEPRLAWSYDTGTMARGTSGPVIAAEDGHVYLSTIDSVVALDTTDGSEAWTRSIETADTDRVASPTVAYGAVYAPGDALRALDPDDGAELWAFETDDPVHTTPTIGEELTFVGTSGGDVYAVDAADGSEVWSTTTGRLARSIPVSDGVAYVAADGEVTALSSDSGDELWSTTLDGAFPVGPVVASETVYVPVDGGIVALDAHDGSERWRVTEFTQPPYAPVVTGNTVVLAVDDTILGLGSEGTQRWRVAPDRGVATSPPAAAGGVVVLGWIDELVAFDREETLWSVSIEGNVTGPPAIARDRIVTTSLEGTVFAFER